MMAYENDILIIPEKYKKMSVSELEIEKRKVLKDLQSVARPKKIVKDYEKSICFKY